METYRQFLSARNLADALLMKYAEEASRGEFPLYGSENIRASFEEVAERLGFRVERIAAPVLQAAE
jgi:hypothetical protein